MSENKLVRDRYTDNNNEVMQGTIAISWGRYGGFYFHKGATIRLCLGWVAITYFRQDLDDLIKFWRTSVVNGNKD